MPLWGWPEGSGPQLTGAQIPRRGQPAPFNYQGFEQIVDAGAGVRLVYNIGEGGTIELLAGQPELLKAALQRMPPWTTSEERTIPIAGANRRAWVMEGDANRRWVIFELDETLAILRYQGQQVTEAVLSTLARLVPLGSPPPD